MNSNMEEIKDYCSALVKTVRKVLLEHAVQYPILALALVILLCTISLPLVSAAALSPLVGIFYLFGYLQSKGLSSVLCAVIFQGALLIAFIFLTFGTVFLLASVANMLLSKYYTPAKGNTSKHVHFQHVSQKKKAHFAPF